MEVPASELIALTKVRRLVSLATLFSLSLKVKELGYAFDLGINNVAGQKRAGTSHAGLFVSIPDFGAREMFPYHDWPNTAVAETRP